MPCKAAHHKLRYRCASEIQAIRISWFINKVVINSQLILAKEKSSPIWSETAKQNIRFGCVQFCKFSFHIPNRLFMRIQCQAWEFMECQQQNLISKLTELCSYNKLYRQKTFIGIRFCEQTTRKKSGNNFKALAVVFSEYIYRKLSAHTFSRADNSQKLPYAKCTKKRQHYSRS